MRKQDWPVPAMILEAVDLLVEITYIVLQIFYGYLYHVSAYKIVLNVVVSLLIYAAFTALSVYPERINGLSGELCTGKVRQYSLRMIRLEKFVFMVSLLIPCLCDVFAITLTSLYSVIAILLMIAIAVFYEIRIIRILRNRKK